MADYDDARLGPSDGDIKSVCVVCESRIACRVGPDEADDHYVRLLSLCRVDSADSHLVGVVVLEVTRQLVELRPVRGEYEDGG